MVKTKKKKNKTIGVTQRKMRREPKHITTKRKKNQRNTKEGSKRGKMNKITTRRKKTMKWQN